MSENPVSFFSKTDEAQVINAIKEAELQTSGEIRVHLEKHSRKDNLQRAQKVFAELGMDKTELRNGILFYIATADHQFSIIGDKGIHEQVHDDFWQQIRDVMQSDFRNGAFADGLIKGIKQAGTALAKYFPYKDDDINELSDEISRS